VRPLLLDVSTQVLHFRLTRRMLIPVGVVNCILLSSKFQFAPRRHDLSVALKLDWNENASREVRSERVVERIRDATLSERHSNLFKCEVREYVLLLRNQSPPDSQFSKHHRLVGKYFHVPKLETDTSETQSNSHTSSYHNFPLIFQYTRCHSLIGELRK
jgi:hypothetical protein